MKFSKPGDLIKAARNKDTRKAALQVVRRKNAMARPTKTVASKKGAVPGIKYSQA